MTYVLLITERAAMAIIGRPREFNRDAALEAAMFLFWRKGFAATSMNDLCDAMGVRSPSLYAAFGSKEELYLEAVARYVDIQGHLVWDGLEEAATARAGVENLLLAATRNLSKSRTTPAGCMAMLAAVGDEWPVTIARVAKQTRHEMQDRLRTRLESALAKGELPVATDIDSLGRFYLGVFQGMAIQARDGATQAELRGIATAAMAAWPGKTTAA
jgi:AcrR family transcriptional regulator